MFQLSRSYHNPVYNYPSPDPFVLKYCGEYWAYSSGVADDGRCFGILRSRDLVHWQPVGGAMEPLAEMHPHYWAPEVTYNNGRFYLYYSAGDEEHMSMRVAVAELPDGPFVDSGRWLTSEKFAIDGHIFIDGNGAWHLFYATDFLDRQWIGTGTVRDRLLDPFTLAGQPVPVTLPQYDWHVYDPQRAEKGGVRWHTVEGPFVLEHKGRYYQMFSGGNWQNLSYGVSYAIADRLETPGEWQQVADGKRVLPILRTLAGQVIGPGHNSVVRGPDNVQLYCVYHRWAEDSSARVLAIDVLDWAGDRLLALGPSNTPQHAPTWPAFAEFFDQPRDDGLGPGWRSTNGDWAIRDGAAVQQAVGGIAEAQCVAGASCLVVEVSARLLGAPDLDGAFGISLYRLTSAVLRFLLVPRSHEALVSWQTAGVWASRRFQLPPDFEPQAYHLFRVEVDGRRVNVALDELAVRWSAQLDSQPDRIALCTESVAAAFAGFALTVGWQNLFDDQHASASDLGWQIAAGDWRVESGQLRVAGGQEPALIKKGTPLASYELVVNARLERATAPEASYGFYPALATHDPGPLLKVERDGPGWALNCYTSIDVRAFPLPGFDATVYQQFRFRKQDGRLAIQWEANDLGTIEVTSQTTQVGLYASGGPVVFDMVRVTALEPYSR